MPERRLRVLSIFGTRPEAVKMAPVVRRLAAEQVFAGGLASIVQDGDAHRQFLKQRRQLRFLTVYLVEQLRYAFVEFRRSRHGNHHRVAGRTVFCLPREKRGFCLAKLPRECLGRVRHEDQRKRLLRSPAGFKCVHGVVPFQLCPCRRRPVAHALFGSPAPPAG